MSGFHYIIKDTKGAFIVRDGIARMKPGRKFDLWKRLQQYASLVLAEKLTISQAFSRFFMDGLVLSWAKNKENKVSLLYILPEFKKLKGILKKRKDLRLKEKIAKFILEKILKAEMRKYWVVYKEKEDRKMRQKFFHIRKTIFSTYHQSCKNLPIYLLQPKK